jgi:hypothetical protein
LPAAAASFTVNDAMLSMAYTSKCPITVARMGGEWLRAPRVRFMGRDTDAASGV